MEDWIQKAKTLAQDNAKDFIIISRETAQEECVDEEWFIDEVIKHMHSIKKQGETKES